MFRCSSVINYFNNTIEFEVFLVNGGKQETEISVVEVIILICIIMIWVNLVLEKDIVDGKIQILLMIRIQFYLFDFIPFLQLCSNHFYTIF